MDDSWPAELLEALGNNPWLQGIVAALSTFVLEDPTTIGCGLLVADGKMSFAVAFVSVSAGIALGDFGLYWIGRWVGPRVLERGWISPARLHQVGDWFGRNLVTAVLLSRFIPGMRLPTYLSAGVFEVSAVRFLGLAVTASLIWTFLLLRLTVHLGQAVFPLLGRWRWPAAAGLVLTIVLVQWLAARRRKKQEATKGDRPVPPVSRFEFWPPWLFYAPVGLYYLWLGLRFRGLTLPTASNPGIYAGGFIGESKSQILSLVPAGRSWVAPWTCFRRPADRPLKEILAGAEEQMTAAGLSYPVVAKPDLGQRGDGVQPIRTGRELRSYLSRFPAERKLILQQLISMPGEAGLLYYRRPGSREGRVFSVTLKHFPTVVGDGGSTLRELIMGDHRASRIAALYLRRHRKRLDHVLPAGTEYPLVFAGNHCQGAVFKDGREVVTRELRRSLDAVAQSMPGFYFGRFDVKFDNLDELRAGRGFKIIEINGAGAEATHIWDGEAKLLQAYRTLFCQFRILFEIGAANRKRGVRPMSLPQLLKEAWRYRRLSARYPETL